MDSTTVIRIAAFLLMAAAVVFVTRDAKARGMNPIGWGIATFLVTIVALPLYLVLRKPIVSQGGVVQQGSLAYCSSCGKPLQPGVAFCPSCGVAQAISKVDQFNATEVKTFALEKVTAEEKAVPGALPSLLPFGTPSEPHGEKQIALDARSHNGQLVPLKFAAATVGLAALLAVAANLGHSADFLAHYTLDQVGIATNGVDTNGGLSSVLTPVVTMSKFQQLDTGMTYSKTVEIIGVDGEEMSRSDMAGFTTVMYGWKNPGGSNMNAMFQNGHLVMKAQFGLE